MIIILVFIDFIFYDGYPSLLVCNSFVFRRFIYYFMLTPYRYLNFYFFSDGHLLLFS